MLSAVHLASLDSINVHIMQTNSSETADEDVHCGLSSSFAANVSRVGLSLSIPVLSSIHTNACFQLKSMFSQEITLRPSALCCNGRGSCNHVHSIGEPGLPSADWSFQAWAAELIGLGGTGSGQDTCRKSPMIYQTSVSWVSELSTQG